MEKVWIAHNRLTTKPVFAVAGFGQRTEGGNGFAAVTRDANTFVHCTGSADPGGRNP